MTQPSPAIVAQSAVQRLPRLALPLLALVYILAGFVGRSPWRSADLTAYGHMLSLAEGSTQWLSPVLATSSSSASAYLPYWLGAASMLALPFVPADLAARVPYVLMLGLTFCATWYATYHLAKRESAQPVAFAFGGEAQPTDYARALADAALLALLACLGLAQLSHETTAAQTQLCMISLVYFGFAAMSRRTKLAIASAALGLLGLVLSGGPIIALLLCVVGIAVQGLPGVWSSARERQRYQTLFATLAVALALLGWTLKLWAWRFITPGTDVDEWRSLLQLLLWFTWPCWPLVLWGIWRWRKQLLAPHLALPWSLLVLLLGCAIGNRNETDRALLPALPMLASLAAMALPTLRRSMAALIDWFTLAFFSFAALLIWVYWVAMQTGLPRRAALNVANFAPGFVADFSALAVAVAAGATLAWVGLVVWRAGRHRRALWKSLVLPAGGATLAWLLLMTLWLPLLDYVRSYKPMVQSFLTLAPDARCVQADGLNSQQATALRHHGGLRVLGASGTQHCDWLLYAPREGTAPRPAPQQWLLRSVIVRPTDRNDRLEVYQRRSANPGP